MQKHESQRTHPATPRLCCLVNALQFHIWDTFNDDHGLHNNEAYAPKAKGTYTWPLEGETGFYKTIIAGPLPPLQCESSVPDDTEYVGCFKAGLLASASLVLGKIGPDGMTAQVNK